MLTTRKNLLMIAAFGALLMACKKDETSSPTPTPTNEEELITTLILTFTDQETPTEVFELRFTDLDGDGGNAPVIIGDTIPANRAFNMTVRVLNESGSTTEEITNEIASEGPAHQFFFQPVGTTLLVAYADADANGQPIGLTNLATTAAPGEGTMTVTLRHEPNKTAAGVINGDITNAGGETDIEVTFPVIVD
jgi:hypothetical protein